jgi:enoyl-CoA hydratase
MVYRSGNFEWIEKSFDGGVGLLRITRPETLSALSSALLHELWEAFSQIANDQTIRAVVLTGQGKAFVAGADIGELRSLAAELAGAFAAFGQQLFRKIETTDTPVIAAVNGFALGGAASWQWHAIFASRRSEPGSGSLR